MTEREKLIETHRINLMEIQESELKQNSKIIKDFLDYCQKREIKITSNDISYVQTIGIIATFPNIVNLLNSKVKVDKEELVDFNMLTKEFKIKPFFSGYLFSENYMVMAHSYFRRAHYPKNNFSPKFIDIFWPFSKNNNEKHIALDFDRVRINVDNRKYVEYDSWFGAKFTQEIENIEDGIIKLRPPLEFDDFDIDFFFDSTYSLDIKWTSYEKIKVFQLEEFKTENYKITKNEVEYFPVKYIHAEFDTELKTFRHFDGAIHFYTDIEYYARRDDDFNYNDKNKEQLKTLSQKLFKINGQIEVEKWIELVSHYLSGDPLIFEYFEGKLPEHIQVILDKIRP